MGYLIGLEIESNEIAFAQPQGRSAVSHCVRTPENLVDGERVVSPAMLSSFIRHEKKKKPFQGNGCVLILPDESTFFRTVTLPPLSEAQLKLNLPYEFRDYVGQATNEYSYDYAVDHVNEDEAGEPVSIDLFAAAGKRGVAEEYAYVLRKAGLNLKEAIPREFAILKLINNAVSEGRVRREDEICFVDFSYSHTHFNIVRNGKLSASKIIDAGVRDIDQRIAEVMNTELYLAADYREANTGGILTKDTCQPVYEKLAVEVMKAVNFYKYENHETELRHVYFLGCGAGIKVLTDTVLEYIKFEEKDLKSFVPDEAVKIPNLNRCLLAVAATLELR